MKNTEKSKFKTFCELVIVSESITALEIAKKLQITPFRSFTKGEAFRSKKSGTHGIRYHNLWAIRSDVILSEEETILPHIQHFENLFKYKINILKDIKGDLTNEISFWIWIETNESGIGLDISQLEMKFINEISNRLHLTLLTNESINDDDIQILES